MDSICEDMCLNGGDIFNWEVFMNSLVWLGYVY